jgi:hypothetical protein
LNPFEDAGVDAEAMRQLSIMNWEQTIVKRMLKFYKIEHEVKELKQKCFDATGKSRLLFTWFMELHPDFPVWFGFDKVRYLHQWDMESFLGKFSKSPAFKAYADIEEKIPDRWLESGKPTGLVFEYIHGMGAAVMSDCDRPLGDDDTRIVKSFRNRRFYFQDLGSFLAALGWSPC